MLRPLIAFLLACLAQQAAVAALPTADGPDGLTFMVKTTPEEDQENDLQSEEDLWMDEEEEQPRSPPPSYNETTVLITPLSSNETLSRSLPKPKADAAPTRRSKRARVAEFWRSRPFSGKHYSRGMRCSDRNGSLVACYPADAPYLLDGQRPLGPDPEWKTGTHISYETPPDKARTMLANVVIGCLASLLFAGIVFVCVRSLQRRAKKRRQKAKEAKIASSSSRPSPPSSAPPAASAPLPARHHTGIAHLSDESHHGRDISTFLHDGVHASDAQSLLSATRFCRQNPIAEACPVPPGIPLCSLAPHPYMQSRQVREGTVCSFTTNRCLPNTIFSTSHPLYSPFGRPQVGLYFEVMITELDAESVVAVGITFMPVPPGSLPGWHRSLGVHSDDGKLYLNNPHDGIEVIPGGFGVNDSIGVGFMWPDTLFFTHNGRLVFKGQGCDTRHDLVPAIGVNGHAAGFLFMDTDLVANFYNPEEWSVQRHLYGTLPSSEADLRPSCPPEEQQENDAALSTALAHLHHPPPYSVT